MKRFGLAVAAGSLLALCVAGTAMAAQDDWTGGPYDFVSGSIKRLGLHDDVIRHFILSAHDGPQGPHGQYTATYGQGKTELGYKGTVTCVNVVGRDAKVGILITDSTRPDAVVGTYEILRVTNYGVPGDGSGDALSPGVFTSTPANCSAPVDDTSPTFAGNFTVHDGG
jgi:hypothetical protein